MTIKNCDGSDYILTGSLNTFDPNSSDINLLNSFDQEATQIGGSPIFYYELLIQTHNTLDLLYREDRGKLWNPNPVLLYAIYEPVPSQNYIDTFGIDAREEMKFEFNFAAVLKALGYPPRWGSRLFTPLLRENWVIVQNNLDQFKLWNPFKLNVIAQKFQESTTTNEGKITQKTPDFKLNEGVLFQESNKC